MVPGKTGSSVLAGHTSSKRDGVFDHLKRLEKGDTAKTTTGGKTCHWVVQSNNERKPAWFTQERMEKLYHIDGEPQLVFMTCSKFLGYGPGGHAIYRLRTVTKLKLTSCS